MGWKIVIEIIMNHPVTKKFNLPSGKTVFTQEEVIKHLQKVITETHSCFRSSF